MSKIVITIEDRDNGHVKIDCDPDILIMLKIAKSKVVTPAEAYALAALAKMMKDSAKTAMDGQPGTPRFKLH